MKRIYLVGAALGLFAALMVMCQKPKDLKDSENYKKAAELIYYNKDNAEKAYNLLEKELQEHPNNGYAYYYMGLLNMGCEAYEEALESLNSAIDMLREDKDGILYAYRLRAIVYLQLGNEHSALKDWQQALRVNPKDVQTLGDRAKYYCEKKMYDKADEDYKLICTYEPSNTQGYIGRGCIARLRGENEEAEKLFTYCIKLDSVFADAYAFRAEARYALGNVGDCIDDLITAIEIDGDARALYTIEVVSQSNGNILIDKLKAKQAKEPNRMEWPYLLGITHYFHEQYAEAIDYFKSTLKIKTHSKTYSMIASCYNEMAEFQQALKYVSQALEMDPEDTDYLSEKAEVLYNMGRGQDAIELYDQYIEADPNFFYGYYRRGFMKDNLDDVVGAIEDYSKAIDLNPEYAYAYLGRGDKYLLQGQREAAMSDYNMVISLDTILGKNNCAQFAYFELGDVEMAKVVETAILKTAPCADNYYDAACLYARMGENEMAIGYLRQSLELGFKRYAHIKNDDDFDTIRNTKAFQQLIKAYGVK